MNDKLAAAIEYLRSRGKYVLDLRQTRERWAKQVHPDKYEPPLVAKVRRIK